MLRSTDVVGAAVVAAVFTGGDIGMFVAAVHSLSAGRLPRPQD
jgi:hypothetical protein